MGSWPSPGWHPTQATLSDHFSSLGLLFLVAPLSAVAHPSASQWLRHHSRSRKLSFVGSFATGSCAWPCTSRLSPRTLQARWCRSGFASLHLLHWALSTPWPTCSSSRSAFFLVQPSPGKHFCSKI